MKSFTRKAIVATIFGTLAMATVSLAGEEEISVKKLPKAVLKAVKEKFPKAEIIGAAKEVEGGKTTYEVLLKAKGRGIDVAMKADGTILEIEKEVSVDELPKAVKKALSAKYPNAKIAKVEVLTKGEGGPVNYEVSLTTEVVLSAKGKIAGAGAKEEGDDDDDKPKAEGKKSKKDDDDKPKAEGKKSKKDDDKDDDDDDDKREKKDKHEKHEKSDKEDKDDD
jgi:hypothetical protein